MWSDHAIQADGQGVASAQSAIPHQDAQRASLVAAVLVKPPPFWPGVWQSDTMWEHQTIVQELGFIAAHGTQKYTWGLRSFVGINTGTVPDCYPISTHSGFYCYTPWCFTLLRGRPCSCVSSESHGSRWHTEEAGHHALQPVWASSDAVRSVQCRKNLSTLFIDQVIQELHFCFVYIQCLWKVHTSFQNFHLFLAL